MIESLIVEEDPGAGPGELVLLSRRGSPGLGHPDGRTF